MSGVDDAFLKVPRRDFLPPDETAYAELDAPLSIGFGQTNSQPSTVRMMLEWLDAKPGQKVLDVGSGSGWTSALLATIVGKRGKVVAVELVPQLVRTGKSNCNRLGIKNVEFHEAATVYGWPHKAPYGRILVSASAKELPQELLDQLAPGGRMVIPVRFSMLVIQKGLDDKIDIQEHPGFSFVPLLPHGLETWRYN